MGSYTPNTAPPAGNFVSDDIVRIAHFYNPDDPSSFDSVALFKDELQREFKQSKREWRHSINTAANNAYNMLIDSASDKKAMCCLFISFL